MKERLITDGRVVYAVCVAKERVKTDGRVLTARGVECECGITLGRVVVSGCVVLERTSTDGRILEAGCIVIERYKTDGGVVVAGRETEQGILTLSGVGDRIAAVRSWNDRLYLSHDRQKGKHDYYDRLTNNAVKCFHVFFNFVV